MSDTCAGTVLITKKACTKLAIANGLCGKHQEQTFIIDARLKGETVCRQFNRGCRKYLTKEDKESKLVTCSECRNKLVGKVAPCKHEGCAFKTEKANDYCGKHKRDVYREEEKNTMIRYCNVDRGCISVLKEGESVCYICTHNLQLKIKNQLKEFRQSKVNCLRCHILPKTTDYFCDVCSPKITFIDSKSKREIADVWNDVYKGAIERNNLILLPYTLFTETVIQPCYYCGRFSETGFNGIDRYDNTKGYIVTNIKPCCTLCNMMKLDSPVDAFLDKVRAIVDYSDTSMPIPETIREKWASLYHTKKMFTLSGYKYKATERKIAFELTEEQYDTFLKGTCFLCGIPTTNVHKNGIDRIDSTKGYIIDNCKTCCTYCNLMKKTSSVEDFVNHCRSIVKYFSPEPKNEIVTEPALRLKKRVELYHATDIYEFIHENTMELFCQWAKESGKTAQFIQGVREVNILDKDTATTAIQRQMEMERTRAYRERDESHINKHYSAATIYAMLENGESKAFCDWYETTYGVSESFDKQFKQLLEDIKTIPKEGGINLCRKFVKAETNRRKSILKTAVKHSMKPKAERVKWVAKTLPTMTNTIVYTDTEEPKQWKGIQIYEVIRSNNGHKYKMYCEEHNEIEDKEAWESKWHTFIHDIQLCETFDAARETIKTFVNELRKIRHSKLGKKKPMV